MSLSALRTRALHVGREHGLLIGSLLRWLLLGSLVGVAAGSASALFLWSLGWVTRTREAHVWLIFLLPAAGLFVGWVYSRFGQTVAGGNNLILEELHVNKGRIPLRMAPFVLGGTLITHLFGGSAGREGTAVQMGGSLADGIARLLALSPEDRRTLLTSGVAGGFGSCFGTPLAGTVFGLEVTQVGGIKYQSLVAALAASFVGDLVTQAWGIDHTLFPSVVGPVLTPVLIFKVMLIGLASGLVSRIFAELVHGLKAVFRRIIPSEPLRPMVGGVIVAALIFGFSAYDYAGLGAPMIMKSFTPGAVPAFAWLWKLLLTAITLGAGFQGGEVTPLFFIGAALGAALGPLMGLPVDLGAATGLVAVFAGAANTPLACIIMGIELFGGGSLPYLGIACTVAYATSGHGGIYSAQRVLFPKSSALHAPDGARLDSLRQSPATSKENPLSPATGQGSAR